MHSPWRKSAFASAVLVMASLLVTPSAVADHDDGVYELPGFSMYDKTHLNVLVVPPNHGQIFNGDTGILNGNDPDELTPFNSYLVAIEDAIQEWEDAVGVLGSPQLKAAYKVDVYVLGRDTVPPEVASDPDILVVTDEDEGPSLGTAIRLTPCIVRMSKSMLLSFTFADMYNVTAQEFGHCLGLQHVGSQGGVDPTSDQKHPEHDVMNGFYSGHFIGEAGTHLHCVSNLDILALEYTMGHVNTGLLATAGPGATTYMPVDYYGDTCDLPPADWRTYASTLPDVPEPEPSPSEDPEDDAFTTSISSPADGSKAAARSFKKVTGTASGPGAGSGSVDVALARVVSKTDCDWWSVAAKKFIRSSCLDSLWNEAVGTTEWTVKVGAHLPAGRYRVMSIGTWADEAEMCCEKGRNLVAFRLTS